MLALTCLYPSHSLSRTLTQADATRESLARQASDVAAAAATADAARLRAQLADQSSQHSNAMATLEATLEGTRAEVYAAKNALQTAQAELATMRAQASASASDEVAALRQSVDDKQKEIEVRVQMRGNDGIIISIPLEKTKNHQFGYTIIERIVRTQCLGMKIFTLLILSPLHIGDRPPRKWRKSWTLSASRCANS